MKWSESPRADPKPAREQDIGRFEITTRDGQARLGKLHTAHGILETPCLLPVINPNIRTIEPREMWDKYGIQALITNSYVIWKHEHLKQESLEKGAHELINYPGVIMTDSGTFQSYIYGDVEVGAEEIVQFQKEIGVDIATMLDVFTSPDMNEIQVEEAVNETIRRSEISLTTADGTMLNGPIQGGTFSHLRVKSSIEMSEFDFSITSSNESKGIIGAKGPNGSSCIIFEWSGTSTKTVGSQKKPTLPQRFPPVTNFAPHLTAS